MPPTAVALILVGESVGRATIPLIVEIELGTVGLEGVRIAPTLQLLHLAQERIVRSDPGPVIHGTVRPVHIRPELGRPGRESHLIQPALLALVPRLLAPIQRAHPSSAQIGQIRAAHVLGQRAHTHRVAQGLHVRLHQTSNPVYPVYGELALLEQRRMSHDHGPRLAVLRQSRNARAQYSRRQHGCLHLRLRRHLPDPVLQRLLPTRHGLVLVKLAHAHHVVVVVLVRVLSTLARRVALRVPIPRTGAISGSGSVAAATPVPPVPLPVPRPAPIAAPTIPPPVPVPPIPVPVAVPRAGPVPRPRPVPPVLAILARLAVVVLLFFSSVAGRPRLLDDRRDSDRRRLHERLKAEGLLAGRLDHLLHLGARAQQQLYLHLFDLAAVVHHRLTGILVRAAKMRGI